jgi:hypothetical protein
MRTKVKRHKVITKDPHPKSHAALIKLLRKLNK